MAQTILLVEPDPAEATLLADGLAARGYRVRRVDRARVAERVIETEPIDAVALDLRLPDMDGLLALAALRAVARCPIVVLGGSRRRADLVLAFRLGADDVARHPYDVGEIHARLEAAIARAMPAPPEPTHAAPIAIGPLTVDPARGRASVGDRRIDLDPDDCRLLVELAGGDEHLLTRKELAGRLWGPDRDNRTLDLRVQRLRAKLRAAHQDAPQIVPLRIQAYRLVAAGSAPGAERLAS